MSPTYLAMPPRLPFPAPPPDSLDEAGNACLTLPSGKRRTYGRIRISLGLAERTITLHACSLGGECRCAEGWLLCHLEMQRCHPLALARAIVVKQVSHTELRA